MNPPSEKPLQKITMNLFRDDVAELIRIFGNGWTVEVRYLIADFVKEHKAMSDNMTFGGAADGN